MVVSRSPSPTRPHRSCLHGPRLLLPVNLHSYWPGSHDRQYLELLEKQPNFRFFSSHFKNKYRQSKSCKAPGPDAIPVDLYKGNIDLWGPMLTLVLRACCLEGKLRTWGEFIIVPIFKKGDRLNPTCYRPISLLDSLVKIAGRVILKRLQDWAETQNILLDLQHGFRPGIGTIEQSLNLNMLIGKYVHAKKGNLYLAFVGLTSAFDCVIHSKLWQKLADLGVEASIISLLRDLYSDCRARVRYGNGGRMH